MNYAFFIVGLPNSGKEIAANLLATFLQAPRASSSSIIFDALAAQRGVPRWELEASPKSVLRPELERVGDALCEADPACLVAPLLKRGVRVIHGVRRRNELRAARAEAIQMGLSPVVVWLDRRSNNFDNTEITRGDADYTIKNYGTVGQLTKYMADLAFEFTATFDKVDTADDSPDLDIWNPSH